MSVLDVSRIQGCLQAIAGDDEVCPGNAAFVPLYVSNFNDVASLSYQIARQDIPKQDWGRFFAGNKRADWNAQNQRLQSLLDEADVRYISKYDAFCHGPQDREECELFTDGGSALIYDTGHLTVAGAYSLNSKAKELNWLLQ